MLNQMNIDEFTKLRLNCRRIKFEEGKTIESKGCLHTLNWLPAERLKWKNYLCTKMTC